jgi:superfamily I DNA and RNA helicase
MPGNVVSYESSCLFIQKSYEVRYLLALFYLLNVYSYVFIIFLEKESQDFPSCMFSSCFFMVNDATEVICTMKSN